MPQRPGGGITKGQNHLLGSSLPRMSQVSAVALRELHRILGQLAELRGRLERGPKQIAAHAASVAKLQAQLDVAIDAVKQTKMLADRKQLDLKSAEAKIADWKVKLNSASSNKEYQAFVEQIAAAEMATSVLSDEILETFERVDENTRIVKECERVLAAGKAEFDKVKQHIEATAGTLRAEVTRLETELADAEGKLPAEFKTDYQRVVRNKGALGLAPVDEDVCTGCGQKITLNMSNQLLTSQSVFCKSCGCLLYLPER